MKNNNRLIAGISSGVLIFIYGLLLLVGGILNARGNDIIIRLFGRWYEGLFLLLTGIAFVGAFVYKNYFSLASAMFFAGIYAFLTISSRLGGGIQYANNFGFILVFVGLGGVISFIGLKPRNPYFLMYGMIMLLSGITFIVSITLKLYWIIAVGLVMTLGISIAAWALARSKYSVNTDADNEKEGYTKNPDRKYVSPYKKIANAIGEIITKKGDKEE